MSSVGRFSECPLSEGLTYNHSPERVKTEGSHTWHTEADIACRTIAKGTYRKGL